MASVVKNPSSMIMVMKVLEPGELATGQDIKLFWLDLLAESIARSTVLLHAASLGLDMVHDSLANLKSRLHGWQLIVLV